MNAAIYLRVSKQEQNEENQEPDCLRICAARDWFPIVFRERESGAKSRKVWQDVLDAVHRGEVGAVVIWALDRAGRDRVRLCHDLAEIGRKGARMVSVRETWLDQPPGPYRDLMLLIITWVAEQERERNIERTKAGQARARATGKHIGRPALPLAAIAAVERAWLSGLPPSSAAKMAGIPDSTARTYYRRFEAAKSAPGTAPQKTAERRED